MLNSHALFDFTGDGNDEINVQPGYFQNIITHKLLYSSIESNNSTRSGICPFKR